MKGGALQDALFAVHDDLARPPVDVIEAEAGDLAGAKPEPGQQEQDGPVTAALARPPVTAGHQALDLLDRRPAGQGGVPAAGHWRDRLGKRCGDDASHVEEAQERAQRGREVLRCRRATRRQLSGAEGHHISGGQATVALSQAWMASEE